MKKISKKSERPTISACLVIHNEEKYIQRCIESFKNIVDEIIIVHSGPCKDKTLEICKKYTKKIFIAPDYGVADPNRALSFSKATKDWILRLDGDEYLSKKLAMKIPKLIQNRNIDAYAAKWDFYHYKNKSLYEYKPFLVRKEKMIQYEGNIHEAIRTKGVMKNIELEIIHTPLNSPYTWKSFKSKGEKWAKIQGEFLVKKKEGNLIIYFLKMIFFPLIYFIYSFIKYKTIRVSFMALIYNFFVYWHAFNKSLFRK